MSEPYVPTTDEIIRSFAIPPHRVIEREEGESFADYLSRLSIKGHGYQLESEAAARRWLAEHDRRVAERAWDEGARWAAVECGAVDDERQAWIAPGDNPHTKGGAEVTEQVDRDAIELRAMRFQKLNPLHECFDSTTVLALIGELRQERERADEGWRTANELNRMHRECHAQRDKAQAAPSRAEETIEKVLELIAQVKAAGEVPVDVYAIERLLTEYDKQKGADRG